MKKGTRVEILPPHPNEGTQGFVFWTGPDKFDEQAFRLGVKDAEGEAIWISSNGVKVIDASGAEAPGAGGGAPRPAPGPVDPNAPAPERGSRVQWASGTGKVFWYGPSKFGEGMRIGAEDDAGEKHWLEAHEVTVLTAAPGGGGGGGGGGGYAPRAAQRTPAQPAWDDGDPGPSDRDAWAGDDADIPF